MDDSEAFKIPDFQAKPFLWDATESLIQKLQSVRVDKKVPSLGLSADEGALIADWVVAGVANRLEELFPRKDRNWCHYMHAKCTIANAIARDILSDVPREFVHNFNMHSIGGVPHAAMILKLPTQPDGVSEAAAWKYFLIDPTFGQFFHTTSVGARLVENEDGSKFAADLLTRGAVELTEDNARLYIGAFIPLRLLPTKLLDKYDGSLLEMLCHADEQGAGRSLNVTKGQFIKR